MAVSREVYRLQRPAAAPRVAEAKARPAIYLVTALLALLALYVVMSHVITWGQITYDDFRYGRPRSFHLTMPVGYPGQGATMTHFVAMNLDRQVMVFEIPEGDTTRIRTLQGPYLFGSGENLTPVQLRREDLNKDGAADLVLQVKDEEVVYLYRDGAFSLISAEERHALLSTR